MEALIFFSFVIASVSFTITVTSIFKWFRELVSPIHPKVEELVHCPYCLGHYIALFFMFICEYRVSMGVNPVIAFIITWFALMGVVCCMHFIMLRAYEPVAKMMLQRELNKRRK